MNVRYTCARPRARARRCCARLRACRSRRRCRAVSAGSSAAAVSNEVACSRFVWCCARTWRFSSLPSQSVACCASHSVASSFTTQKPAHGTRARSQTRQASARGTRTREKPRRGQQAHVVNARGGRRRARGDWGDVASELRFVCMSAWKGGRRVTWR